MKQTLRSLIFAGLVALGLSASAQTLTNIQISPTGGSLKQGSSLQFSATCSYSDNSSKACPAGVITWGTSTPTSNTLTVSSSGLATVAPNTGGCPYVTITAGTLQDRAGICIQSASPNFASQFYQYVTPEYNDGNFIAQDTHNQNVQLPLNVVVGSTVAIGTGFCYSDASFDATGKCNDSHIVDGQDNVTWVSSDTSKATVDRLGHVTGIAPGSVTITATEPGDAVFGTSNPSLGGWQSPGNFINLTIVPAGTGTTTWYVRPDGGTLYTSTDNQSGQCDGKHDASLASALANGGNGVNMPCAAGNFRHLWARNTTYYIPNWVIAGGDTVLITPPGKNYDYQLGFDSDGGPLEYKGQATGMPTIPSGRPNQHTQILGTNYASCSADSAKTRLISNAGSLINVTDSQFVDVGCLELTDTYACSTDSAFSNYCGGASYGIRETGLTADDAYTDVFIHGLGHSGIFGPSGTSVVAKRLHIRGMPMGGVNMDDNAWGVGNLTMSGGFEMDDSITEFTGCVEEYPIVHNYPYIECRGQGLGAYGDAFGTANANGIWIFHNDIWRDNWQDGLDLLHSGLQQLVVTGSQSYGNLGQSYKIGSGQSVTFQNNFALQNCDRLAYPFGDEPAGGYNLASGENLCRAGDDIKIEFDGQGTDIVDHNTVLGYGNTLWDLFCNFESCATTKTSFTNNIVVGLTASTDNSSWNGSLPANFCLPDCNNSGSIVGPVDGWLIKKNNLYFNSRSYMDGTNEVLADPNFVGETNGFLTQDFSGSNEYKLDNFNYAIQSSSPARGAGVVDTLTTDQAGNAFASPPAEGALEVNSSIPPPAITISGVIAQFFRLVHHILIQ